MSNNRTTRDIQDEMNYLTQQLQTRELSLDEYYTLYSELEDEMSSIHTFENGTWECGEGTLHYNNEECNCSDYPCDIINEF